MNQFEIESTILAQCRIPGAGKTICPTDAAKTCAADCSETGLAWQHWLPPVRRAAIAMALRGELIIYRKGKPADPNDFRGVYRLGLPRLD